MKQQLLLSRYQFDESSCKVLFIPVMHPCCVGELLSSNCFFSAEYPSMCEPDPLCVRHLCYINIYTHTQWVQKEFRPP